MIKRISLLAVMTVMVSSCGQQAAQQADVAKPVAENCPAAAKQFYNPLPDDSISLDFPFHLKSDRIYVTDKGETKRGLVFEYLQGNAEQNWSDVAKALGAAGYEAAGEKGVDKDGRSKQNFRKAGKPVVSVVVQEYPVSVANPANPDAKGIFQFSWVMSAAAPASASSAE